MWKEIVSGLTKREYLAAMAMQGMMSVPIDENMHLCGGGNVANWIAKNSVLVADALLKELADSNQIKTTAKE